ncbi:MAG: hypothetical protein ACM3SQ_02965 [Betaproteobacteria bacterium]
MVQQSPIIVKIVESPRDPTGISDVLIQALGFTGFVVLVAVVLGLAIGAVMFWIRSRRPLEH